MKAVIYVFSLVLIGVLGYSYEPSLRNFLGSFAFLEKPKVIQKPAIAASIPEAPAMDLTKIPIDKLPREISVKKDFVVIDIATKTEMPVTAGQKVRFVRLAGANAVIAPKKGAYQGTIPISHTDLMDLVLNTLLTEKDQQEKPVEPAEETVAAEAPAPAPAAPVVEEAKDPIEVMKASIQANEIKEFSFDRVTDWKLAEQPEVIDGESYQIGLASYNAQTVFGAKAMVAKALIKNNKVVRWVGSKSGMQIK